MFQVVWSMDDSLDVNTICLLQIVREKSSPECFDKLPLLRQERRTWTNLAALCAVNHCQNTHTVHTIKMLFLQVFGLLFLKFLLAVKVELVEVAYYLKQVFHLLYDKSVWLVEVLLHFYLCYK